MKGNDPLRSLLESAEHDRAVEHRRRLWQLREAEASLATWQGALMDLAEMRARVWLELAGDRRRHGHLLSVGHDHLLLSPEDPARCDTVGWAERERIAVSLAAVRSVRHVADYRSRRAVHSDRVTPVRRHLIEVLEELAAEAVPVTIALRSSRTLLQGETMRVGVDLLVLAGANDALTVVPVDAISDVSWGRR